MKKPSFNNLFTSKHSNAKIEQLRYLSQASLIEEAKAPQTIRMILMLISSLIVVLIIWSALTEVAEIAVSQGEIVPNGYIQSIQHLEGGIIEEIKVVEGELVEKGQPLVSLNGTALRLDLSSLSSNQLELEYQAHRLKSYIEETAPNFTDISEFDEEAVEKLQQKAYQSMIDAKIAEQNIINEQIIEKKDSLDALFKKKNTLVQNFELVKEERNLKQELYKRGNLSKFKFLEMEQKYNNINGSVDEIESNIKLAESAIDEYEHRLKSLNKKSINSAYQSLAIITAQLSGMHDNIKKLEEQIFRLDIRSPAYGVVKGIKVKTIGGVVEPGKIIMEIVPLEDVLFVETKINPKNIGNIRLKQLVKVKVSAFDSARYGSVEGTLEYVSATTFIDTDGTKYYLGRVRLNQNYIGTDPAKNLLIPGMTVSANIVTGKKSILRYLLKPVQSATSDAFTEK